MMKGSKHKNLKIPRIPAHIGTKSWCQQSEGWAQGREHVGTLGRMGVGGRAERGGPGPGWPRGWGPGPGGELRAEGRQEGECGAGDADLPLGVGGQSAM